MIIQLKDQRLEEYSDEDFVLLYELEEEDDDDDDGNVGDCCRSKGGLYITSSLVIIPSIIIFVVYLGKFICIKLAIIIIAKHSVSTRNNGVAFFISSFCCLLQNDDTRLSILALVLRRVAMILLVT